MVIHGNETPCSLGRGRNPCWSILPPLVLHFGGEWPAVLPNRRHPQDTSTFFFILFKAFSAGIRAIQYHCISIAFSTVPLPWAFCFFREKRSA